MDERRRLVSERPEGRRRKDDETDFKMRILSALLGVLVILLLLAMIFAR